jgi:hypothetical protein
VRELEARPPERVEVEVGPDPELLRRLETRENELAQRATVLDERERALERRVQALTMREHSLAREAVDASREAVEPAPRGPDPIPTPTPTRAATPDSPPPTVPLQQGRYNLGRLDALFAGRRAEFPERAEEWESYLFFLRDHAELDGSLPATFDPLIEDVFGELLGR